MHSLKELLVIPGWFLTITNFIGVPVLAWTFYKVWYGTRYRVLLLLVALLELGVIAYAISGVSLLMLAKDVTKRDEDAAVTWFYVS